MPEPLPTALILGFVTAQRLGEIALARRNTQRLVAQGGHEVAAGHYPLLVALHIAWLFGLWLSAWGRGIETAFLLFYIVLQMLRVWVLVTLGGRWTTRIIVVPGERLVTDGPYRFVRHPNYLVVAAEIACLPLVFGMVATAAVFSVLNAVALTARIRAEDKALAAARRLEP